MIEDEESLFLIAVKEVVPKSMGEPLAEMVMTFTAALIISWFKRKLLRRVHDTSPEKSWVR